MQETNGDNIAWWENQEFIRELEEEYADWKTGVAAGYTIEEANALIEKLRSNKNEA